MPHSAVLAEATTVQAQEERHDHSRPLRFARTQRTSGALHSLPHSKNGLANPNVFCETSKCWVNFELIRCNISIEDPGRIARRLLVVDLVVPRFAQFAAGLAAAEREEVKRGLLLDVVVGRWFGRPRAACRRSVLCAQCSLRTESGHFLGNFREEEGRVLHLRLTAAYDTIPSNREQQ